MTFFGFTALSVETRTKRSHAELDGDLGDHAASPSTLLRDRLERVRLHQRHVLVRGGVEDDRRAGSARRPGASSARFLHVGEHRHRRGEAALVDELALDLESAFSAWSTSTMPLGAERGDLAAELGADRAAGAGDEHGRRRRRTRRSRRGRPRPARGRARPRPAPARIWRARSRSPAISSCRPGQRLHRARLALAASSTIRCAHLARRGRDRDQHLVRAVVARGCAAARRSCRARGRRAGAGSSCAGRRRRGRSACSRAAGVRSISRTISWPASPAPTTITSLPRATSAAAAGAR